MRRHPRHHALALASLSLLAANGSALAQGAATAEWTDWTAGGGTRLTGVLVTGGQSIGVTFSGVSENSFLGAPPEPYWGPASTYQSAAVVGAPPNRDLIVIGGGPTTGTFTISFSEAVQDPILAIASLGLSNSSGTVNIPSQMWFNRPVEVLSNGPNFFANGRFTPFSVLGGTDLYGTESSGVVRFRGSFTQISWTTPIGEFNESGNLVGTYMFNVGTAGCLNHELRPLTQDTVVRAACSAYTSGAEFTQQRRLEVRGRLRSEGRYVLAGDLDIQAGGRADLFGGGYVAPAGHVDVAGRLAVSGPLGVAGRLRTEPGSFSTFGDVTVEPLGELKLRGQASLGGAVSINGLLEVGAGGQLTVVTPLIVGGQGARLAVAPGGQLQAVSVVAQSGATLDVGGELHLLAGLDVAGSTVQVQAGGRLTAAGPGTLFAAVANAGSFEVLAGDLEMPGGAFNNSGTLRVAGGTFTPGAAAVLTNLAGGRIEVTGGALVLGGSGLSNQGAVSVSGGRLALVSGTLLNAGEVQSAGAAQVLVNAGATVLNSGTMVLGGSFSNAGLVNNTRQLTLRPETASFENLSQIVSSGSLVVDAGALGGVFINANLLRNDGSMEIGPGTRVVNQGLLANNGTLTVNGFLELDSGSLAQSPGGRLVVNGRLSTAGGLVLDSGALGGDGVIDGALLLSGSATVLPGNSPGTLTVTGAVELGAGSRLELEIDARGAHDALRAGELLQNGGLVSLRFVDGVVPDIDQSFELVRVDRGSADLGALGGLPEGLSASEYRVGGLAGERLSLAFQRADAQLIGAGYFDLWPDPFVDAGATLYADGHDGDLVPHQGRLTVAGTLGLRRDAVWRTEGSMLVTAEGRFSTSSRELVLAGPVQVAGGFVNRGQTRLNDVRVDAGGRFVNEGQLVSGEGAAAVTVDNRGLVRHGGGNGAPASWTLAPGSTLRLDNRAGARWEVAAPMDVAAGVANGGDFIVAEAGVVAGLEALVQVSGRLHVDGRLAGSSVEVTGGRVSGRGRIEAPLALFEPVCCSAAHASVVLQPGGEDGRTPGTLTLSQPLQMRAGSLLEFVVGADGQAGRLALEAGGSFANGVQLQVVLFDGALPLEPLSLSLLSWTGDTPDDLWTVANFGSRVVVRDGFGDSDWTGGTWALDLQQGELQLVLTPVPEPGTYGLMLAGLGLVAWLARRRDAGRRG